jgi:hypothetical protein
MPVGDIYKTRVVTSVNGQNGINVLHFQLTGITGTGSNDATMASTLDHLINGEYKALMANSVTYRGIGTQRIFPLPVLLEATSVGFAGSGTGGVGLMGGNVAGLISWRTAVAGRKGRGRSFIPFPSSVQNTSGGNPIASYLTSLNVLAGTLKTTLTVGTAPNQWTFTFGVYGKKTNSFTPVVTSIQSPQWWSQRRREFGRKPDLLPF